MQTSGLRARLLGASALTLIAGMASAQGTDLGTLVLGEGKRIVQTDTATPVTTIDQDEIDDRQAGTIAQLVESVPGVSLVNGSTPTGSGINIRGFGANSTFGTDQKVLILVDGATVGSEELYRIGTQLYTDPELFKSVSVIRGTVGSFQYGSGVIGGLIQLETKDASDFTNGPGFAARQTLQFNSNGSGKIGSTILAFESEGGLEVLANYTLRIQDNMKDGSGTVIGNTKSRLPSYLVKVGYTFGQDSNSRLEFSHSDTTTAERDAPYNAFLPNTDFFGNVDRDTDTKTTTLAYNFNPASDLVDLDVVFSYADQKIDSVAVSGQVGGAAALANADHRYRTRKLTVSNGMLFDTGAFSHDLRVGGEIVRKTRLDAAAADGGKDRRFAFFVVDEIQMGGLTLSPALRYESSKVIDTENPGNGPFTNDAVMGGLSTRYEFDSGFSVFGSAAYTENLPIIDDLGNVTLMNQSEKSRTLEFGFGYDSGSGLSAKINAYDTKVWDVTSYRAAGPTGHTTNVNRQGVEVELSYAMENGFYVDFNGSVSSGEQRIDTGALADWRNNPANRAQITVGRKFATGWDVSYELVTEERRVNNGAGEINPGWGISNLRATYKPQSGLLEGAEVRFGIENLFDKDYQSALATRKAPGRNIKLTIGKTF